MAVDIPMVAGLPTVAERPMAAGVPTVAEDARVADLAAQRTRLASWPPVACTTRLGLVFPVPRLSAKATACVGRQRRPAGRGGRSGSACRC